MNIATGGILAKNANNRPIVRALENINLELRDGDRLGVIGHNGSGKTTLLQALAGIYEPTSGEIYINGSIASMLNITLGINEEITGIDNIYLRAKLMGAHNGMVSEVIEDIIEFAGIGDFINLPMRTYSSGMIMRLAFAIATSFHKDIVLMDEWLSVGDTDFQEKANSRLRDYVDRTRLLIIASHDHAMISKICNKILVLKHGRVISFKQI